MNKAMSAGGLLIACVAASFLLMDLIDSGVAAAIGILGIGLIAVARRK